jgi:GNAT superfamily N-acetyltransferase
MSELTRGRPWQVRTANAGDLPFVHDGELAYIREREPAQETAWLRAVERNRALWSANLDRTTVVECAGQPAAYVMWAVLDAVATVVTLYVLPAHRGHGLGAALVEVAVRDARRDGHDVLALGVHRDNPARHLYESAGFSLTGEDDEYLLFRRSLVS